MSGPRYPLTMSQSRTIVFLAFVAVGVPVAVASEVAEVVTVEGEVKADSRVLREGDSVRAGEMIRTGGQGSVKLLLADKSVVDLSKRTAFKVDSSMDGVGSSTTLEYGMVRSAIRKKLEKKLKFQMKTKTSVLAVRGTEFVVNSSKTSSANYQDQITVSDGQVAVGISGAEARILNPGQQLQTVGRELASGAVRVDPTAAKIVQVPPEAQSAITSQATVSDTTFQHRVEISQEGSGRGPNQGAATLAAAIATGNLVKPADVNREMRPGQEGQTHRPGPKPQDVAHLNAIDGGRPQTILTQGVTLRVLFQP
jgi:hypothetical protein